MKVKARPAGTDALPHRKNYDNFVRIVEPGRHVFRCRMNFERTFYATFGVALSGFLAWLGFNMGKVSKFDAFGIGLMVLMWTGALVVTISNAWAILHDTVVEITLQDISMKRRRFVCWSRRKSWNVSSFLEATLLDDPVIFRGKAVPEYRPVLEFDTFDTFIMGGTLDSKELADEYVRDINASVEQARLAPRTF